MYTKFITLFLDDIHDEEKGFLTAARFLSENGIMGEERRTTLKDNLHWIEKNLKKRPFINKDHAEDILHIPMSWLKESAIEHIQKMDQIREILEENDILVEVLQVERPGEIVYEDEHQIIAIPFRSEPPLPTPAFINSLN